MYSVTIRIPRRIYINSRLPPGAPGTQTWGPRVTRRIVGTHPVYNMYQCVMNEVDFHHDHGRIAVQLSSREVEGVYEGQVPLVFEAAIELGCCVMVAPHAMHKAMGGDVFDVQDLEVRGGVLFWVGRRGGGCCGCGGTAVCVDQWEC